MIAAVSGAAFIYNGAMVAYQGFVPSIIKLVGLLLAVWTIIIAALM